MRYAAEDGEIRIALTGESLVTRPVSACEEPEFLGLVDLLRAADVAVTNAEVLFHDYEHPPTVAPGGTYMRSAPSIIEELKWMGINMVAVANNHAYDYGESGLLTHLRNLEGSGIVHAGIGRSMSEAREPHYLETKVGRVALISATSSGPAILRAGHQGLASRGRPGANFIRYTNRYVVDQDLFDALKRMRDTFNLNERQNDKTGKAANHTWGMSDLPDTDTEFYMGDLHDSWQYPVPNGYRIALGSDPDRQLVADEEDIEENLQQIREARRNADWVIVSIHSHERGLTADDPPDFVRSIAYAAIDAGADVIHGHGPHRDRGIEIYHGRPIFYSLGHFFLENDTVGRVPLENMRRQGLNPASATPADFADARSGRELEGEWLGSASRRPMWQDVVGLVSFSGGELTDVSLIPIDLGFGRPRFQRGRPMLASGQESDEVLALMKALSKPFGTKIDVDGDVAKVRIEADTKHCG